MINKVLSLVCAVCNDLKLLSLFTIVNSVASVIVGTAMVAAVECHFARQKAVARDKKVKSSAKADLTCNFSTSMHLKSAIVLTFLLFGNVGDHDGLDNRQHQLGACSVFDAAAENVSPRLVLKVVETAKQSNICVRNALQNSIILFENQTLIFNSTSHDVENVTTEGMVRLIIFVLSVKN